MELKAFAATLGIGMLAGAAVTLMMPKQSKVYQTASDTADKLKDGVVKAFDSMTEN